jgi:hypothetical protein
VLSGDGVPLGETPCAVCEVRLAEWLHHLDSTRSHFRVYGKGHVWGSPVALCEACDEALARSDVDALVSRDLSGEDLGERLRSGYGALIGATVQRESLLEATPLGWQDALAAGFTPIEQITGALHLVDGWPAQHKRSVPARDPEDADYLPDGRHWFIRSPWPSVDLGPLWRLIIETIESVPDPNDGRFTREVELSEVALVHALTSLDEQAILRRLRSLP